MGACIVMPKCNVSGILTLGQKNGNLISYGVFHFVEKQSGAAGRTLVGKSIGDMTNILLLQQLVHGRMRGLCLHHQYAVLLVKTRS